MGELHGRPHSDGPEPDRRQPPTDVRRPNPRVEVRYEVSPRPAPGPADVLINPRATRDRPPDRKREAVDGPTHRPPDLIPPRGEDLAEMDAPGAPRRDRVRNKLLEAETLENTQDAVSTFGGLYQDAVLEKPKAPPTAHTEMRAADHGPTMYETPRHGLDAGDTLTAMLVTGILLGEGLRWTYRKASELKERWHGRNR